MDMETWAGLPPFRRQRQRQRRHPDYGARDLLPLRTLVRHPHGLQRQGACTLESLICSWKYSRIWCILHIQIQSVKTQP